MKTKLLIIIILCFIQITSCNKTMTTPTPTKTPTPLLTSTPNPTQTPTLIPSPTPEGGYPQIYIGISPETVNSKEGCGFASEYGGDVVFWTANYGTNENPLDFWEANTEINSPGEIHGTRNWRGNLDICVYPNQPITFQMESGVVTEVREDDNDHLVKIYIDYLELEIVYAHLIPNENLYKGEGVYHGDLIGWTNPDEILDGQYNVLNIGLFCNNNSNPLNFGYCRDQGFMLIGFDGHVNLMR